MWIFTGSFRINGFRAIGFRIPRFPSLHIYKQSDAWSERVLQAKWRLVGKLWQSFTWLEMVSQSVTWSERDPKSGTWSERVPQSGACSERVLKANWRFVGKLQQSDTLSERVTLTQSGALSANSRKVVLGRKGSLKVALGQKSSHKVALGQKGSHKVALG